MAVLRCTEAFAYSEKNGVERVLRPGDLVDDKDPAVQKAPQYFESAEANAFRATERAVEQATAAPAEKRARSPRKAAAE